MFDFNVQTVTAFKADDGTLFTTLEAARKHNAELARSRRNSSIQRTLEAWFRRAGVGYTNDSSRFAHYLTGCKGAFESFIQELNEVNNAHPQIPNP